jgi:hypothetical protein
MSKTRKNRKHKKKRHKKKIYTRKNFESDDGMLTSVWGPSLWHFLHLMSFNYPVNPTSAQKKEHRKFILNLEHILPCGYCRKNLKGNLKSVPLNKEALKNRNNFSRWMYNLHERINKMLGKKSNLSYCDVRERFEHFRSRCTLDLEVNKKIQKMVNKNNTRKKKGPKKEKGCTEPLYGKKSKCVIKIIPKDDRVKSFQMDKKCIKKR